MEKNTMKPFTDKYFLRANQILKAEGYNPWVNMQVFVRKGPGKLAGVDEAVDLLRGNSNLAKVGGRIYARKENQNYGPKDTVMNIVAPIQEIMELETLYLGVLTDATTKLNDGYGPNFKKIGETMEEVNELTGDRPVLYFGARHTHWKYDTDLAKLAFEKGLAAVATDNGAALVGKEGTGTMPHALQNVFAYYVGVENAVKEATLAFDRTIDPEVQRVTLGDYANREITDTIATAQALEGRLGGVRFDTCGENLAEGAVRAGEGDAKYWTGNGVTVMGTHIARLHLEANKFTKNLKVGLSSGFSNPEKVRAFNEGEKLFGKQLYDFIGAGFLDGMRTFTADITAVGEEPDQVDYYTGKGVEAKKVMHKVGRPPRPNKELERIV